ncbi:MAG: HAD-IC family P-type ATPase [Candidatus Limiplasma sp.]|nr:HAD-IC family P-type ATPase [Candidatus Limiplasma sp.]
MPEQPTTKPQGPAAAQPQGLSTAQAARLAAQGRANRMPRTADGGVAAIVRRNIFTLFNLINLLMAALLVWVGSYRNLLFLGVVICNAGIGLAQELRAKRMHDRLQLLSEGRVRTLRDGAETLLPPAELVEGDVIRLRRGDQLPGDGLALEGSAAVNEALLTGESEPLPKTAGDALLSGSYLTEGSLTVRLTAVGERSFAGRLQKNARRIRRPHSELMASLQRVIRWVSAGLVPLGAALYLRQTAVLGLAVPTAVTKTVGAMLGMIPEGLMLLTSVALAVGVVRLGRRNALVNELYGIENLARVDVLCLDKTGTLTGGQMRLSGVEPAPGVDAAEVGRALQAVVAAFAGDDSPTLAALAQAYPPAGEPAVATVPFGSDRKWSAATFATLGTLVLGAPETTLAVEEPLRLRAAEQAAQGLRVLAFLRCDAPLQGKTLPPERTALALLFLEDAPRPEAAEALRYFAREGVSVKVISGDSALTASRVAAAVGLPDAALAVDCSAMDRTPDYDALAARYTVFGRVSPEDKRELVLAYKRAGHAVGMIGDGVNDVPALKAADCSIAMAGGSDAAARVAQLTLLHADFTVTPAIVLEGRRVINNITRAASLFLVKNLFSFLLAALLLVLPFAYPFAPIQMTLVSTLTIGFPSFVLALQPSRERVRGRFLRNVLLRALPGGITVAAVCVGVLIAGAALALPEAQISTICTLAAAFSGLGMLLCVSLPLNALRGALLAAMTAALLTATLLFPSVFYLTPLTGPAPLLLGIAFAAAGLLLTGLTLLLRRVR